MTKDSSYWEPLQAGFSFSGFQGDSHSPWVNAACNRRVPRTEGPEGRETAGKRQGCGPGIYCLSAKLTRGLPTAEPGPRPPRLCHPLFSHGMRKYLRVKQYEFKPQPPALELGNLPDRASPFPPYGRLTCPAPGRNRFSGRQNTRSAVSTLSQAVTEQVHKQRPLCARSPLPFSLVFFLHSSLSLSPPTPQAGNPKCPKNPFSKMREGSQSTVRVGRPSARPAPLPASWGVPEGWARGGAKVSKGGGWAGGALESAEEGRPDKSGGSRVLRLVPGQGMVAWKGTVSRGVVQPCDSSGDRDKGAWPWCTRPVAGLSQNT